jgi:hypothetical protein
MCDDDFFNKIHHILQHNFEAIHNKDYSVVKTFKAASLRLSLFFGINYYFLISTKTLNFFLSLLAFFLQIFYLQTLLNKILIHKTIL